MEAPTLLYLQDLEALQSEAVRFAKTLTQAEGHATLVTLSGDLGTGKTSFVQGVARALGIEDPITSPTFVLEKVYDLPAGNTFTRLIHIDAYRLEGDTSLMPLGFHDRYADRSNLIMLEWPELVASQLPDTDHALTLSVSDIGRELSYA